MRKKFTESDDQIIIAGYSQGESLRNLAKRFSCSPHAISNILIRNNIERRTNSQGKSCKTETLLSQNEKEMIDGLLLSDASIQRTSNTARLNLVTIHKEFSQHVADVLSIKSNFYHKKAYVGSIRGNVVYSKESYPLYTMRDIAFNKIHDRWYVNKKKIVPEDLTLSPDMVKYWFYGDGCSSKTSPNRVVLKFSTESFTLKECERLVHLLYVESGSMFKIAKIKDDQYVLKCYKQVDVCLFFDYIGECDLQCFDYKWKLQ